MLEGAASGGGPKRPPRAAHRAVQTPAKAASRSSLPREKGARAAAWDSQQPGETPGGRLPWLPGWRESARRPPFGLPASWRDARRPPPEAPRMAGKRPEAAFWASCIVERRPEAASRGSLDASRPCRAARRRAYHGHGGRARRRPQPRSLVSTAGMGGEAVIDSSMLRWFPRTRRRLTRTGGRRRRVSKLPPRVVKAFRSAGPQ